MIVHNGADTSRLQPKAGSLSPSSRFRLFWKLRRQQTETKMRNQEKERNKELEGFVLFCSVKGQALDYSIGMLVSCGNIRITYGAFRFAGKPDYVNVFFDEPG